MKLEDIRYDFPKMPKEMRTMIEKEVEKQIKMPHPHAVRAKKAAGRTLAASVAAVLLFSTTVFAGVSIYRMRREQTADHSVKVSIEEQGENQADLQEAGGDRQANPVIPDVKIEIGYLPEGMVQTEQCKYSFKDAMYKGGFSIALYRMDTGDSAFDMLHTDVLDSEDISVDGNDGVYLEYPQLYEDDISFNKRIYVAYTDVHYVMQMYAASDLSKEEAIKIAESIRLIPAKDPSDQNIIQAWNWSGYLASLKEQQSGEQQEAVKLTASKEEMKDTHKIGESFTQKDAADDSYADLRMKVSDVQISEDLSLLSQSLTDEELQKETDGSGKLRPACIQYIKDGDADSLSEVISSREVPQKLVYATIEYTNTGDKELSDVLFFGSLVRIIEENGQMRIASGQNYEEPSSTDTWTSAVNRGLSGMFEMQYYDVHGGERHNNYIESIKPQETVTVHMGWIVTEEELDSLYIDLNPSAGAYEFSDASLKLGYVDIRQKD